MKKRFNFTSADARRIISALCFLIGTPFFIFCYNEHICMAGHMHHPPYPKWHLASEFAWIASYVISAVLAVRSNIRCKTTVTATLTLLCLSRISGSGGGGINLLFEFPILIFLFFNSIIGLIFPARSLKKDIEVYE